MKIASKLLAVLLVGCMLVAVLASCGGKKVTEPTVADPLEGKTHLEVSNLLYGEALADFKTNYDAALAADTLAERYALMAIAEAKLLEAGVMLPSTANGGNYAISRVVPYTITPCLWGNDSYRYHQVIVLAGNQNPLTPTERDQLKALWKTSATAEAYETAAKAYLATKGYATTDEYTIGYNEDPSVWDPHASYYAVDGEPIVNTFDGLMEYDLKNEQQFALATALTVSDDGLTYTFTIRQGVKWVDSQGRELADLTAQDFVNGLRHVMDAQGGLEYLIDGVIVGATEYMAGEGEFEDVGVKATDDYTLVYKLTEPFTYFQTMLGYTIFAPICSSYFLANGGAFGVDEFDEASKADTYVYGTNPDHIAYCGPYLVTSWTPLNSIVFEANEAYWNKDNINVKKITWKFADSTNAKWAYENMKAGVLASSGLNTTALQQAKSDKVGSTDKSWYETYAYVSALDASSFPVFFNLYRCQYANFNDDTAVVSGLTDNQKNRANIAMRNKNFRLALAFAIDRGAYNATTVGDELKLNSLVNSYTPGNFVSLPEAVTVKINGTDTTFAAGTYYGAIMQAQITADGGKMKVWDPTLEAGLGSSTGFDGWYNVTAAREYLAAAITELEAAGVPISADLPLVIEMPYYDINEVYTNRSNALKQSIEASLEGKVVISLVKTGGSNARNWYYSGYYPQTGDKMNYNIVDVCGWGPDYGDPATYLDTMLPQGGGMAKNLGLY